MVILFFLFLVDTIIKKNYIVKKGFISFDEFLSILA